MHKISFTKDTIAKLFGQEDAAQENQERLGQYFIRNSAFEDAMSDQNLVILVGHKGSGKSATMARSHTELSKSHISIEIEPTEILAAREISSDDNFNAIVSHWQEKIQQAIANNILTNKFDLKGQNATIQKVSTATGKFVNRLKDALRQSNRQAISMVDDTIIENFINDETRVYVHIDDLDQGWTSSNRDIRKISAILSALRNITKSSSLIKFRITLRSDIYYLVRTSDESTDKIEGFVSWVTWTNHDVLVLLCKRILTYFGEKPNDETLKKLEQSYMSAHIFSMVMDAKFSGRGKWSNKPIHYIITSLVRRSRPRDMVKLLTLAAQNAGREASKIHSSHFQAIFESYSSGRITDIENEFKSELPNINQLILGMKPNKIQRRANLNYVYTTDALSKKIGNIISTSTLKFTNGSQISARALIQFLYKIDFITGRKNVDGALVRYHFDNNQLLINEVNDMGFDWEIHPAYRWALQPGNVQNILDDLELS